MKRKTIFDGGERLSGRHVEGGRADGPSCWPRIVITALLKLVLHIESFLLTHPFYQCSANFFCKGPNSICYRLCRFYVVFIVYSLSFFFF